MCGLGGGKAPPAIAPPAPVPEAADASRQTEVTKKSGDDKRRMAAGQQGTILTGARGLQDGLESGAKKTLLGA